jgi:hypothetical protein
MADKRLSNKSKVVEILFLERWNPETGELRNSVINFDQVQEAIRQFNDRYKPKKLLSVGNPANFLKDFIRKKRSGNANWPELAKRARYTARQLTGNRRCFEFIPMPEGQNEPFPLDLVPQPDELTKRVEVQSVNLPLESRKLGRTDEPWLIQVMVRLRVIESHLALIATNKIVQLVHLQNNVKLSSSEVDALFLGTEQNGETREILITLEAKGRNDDILEDQILQQVRSVFRAVRDHDEILPMAAKAIAPSEIYLIEFERVRRDEIDAKERLKCVSRAIYVLKPHVPGVGGKIKGKSARKKDGIERAKA